MATTVILIPAYNPNSGMVQVVTELGQKNPNLPIVIVNDGSDEDKMSFFDAIRDLPNTHLIRNAINLGKGAALKNGINYILTHYPYVQSIVTADADGQHATNDILNVCQIASENPESLVLGCRSFSKDIPLRSRLGNNISKVVYKLTLGLKLDDTQTGLRALPLQLAKETLSIKANRYELETEQLLLVARNKIPVIQLPIETIYEDNNSASHFNPVFDSIRIYYVLLRYGFSSILTALVDFVSFIIVNPFLNNLIYSNLASRVIALFVQFVLLRNFVFKAKGRALTQFVLFTFYVAIVGVISGVMQEAMLEWFSRSKLLNKVLVESLLFIFNFLFLRDILFKKLSDE